MGYACDDLRKAYRLVGNPAVEPVSLSDMKVFLKDVPASEDAVVSLLIATARRAAEAYTGRALITQTWELVQDGFCAREVEPLYGWSEGPTPEKGGSGVIQLSHPPIQSITSIQITNPANVTSSVSASIYTLDTASGRVLLNEGSSWPSDLRSEASVKVTFVAGYGPAGAAVPEDIRQAIQLYVLTMYENRACADMPDGVKTLLDPYRTAEVFGAW